MRDPAYRKYKVIQRRTLRDYKQRFNGLVQKLDSGVCIRDKFLGPKMGYVRLEPNTALDRPLPNWQYSASDNTKWVVDSFPDVVSSNASTSFIDLAYRHVAVSPDRQTLRLAQNLANGGGLDYYISGRIDNQADRSGFAGVRSIYHYHADHEGDYSDLVTKSDVALLTGPDCDQQEFRR